MYGADIKLNVIVLKKWMRFPCRECGRILAEGQFSVGITLKEDNGTIKNFMLCIVPPVICCRAPLEVQQLFATREIATSKADEINDMIAKHKSNPESLVFWIYSNFIEIPQ